jgi:molybdopterin molybdotransferase
MLTVEEAQRIVLDSIQPAGDERVHVLNALGRVLTAEIAAPFDIPPHNNSSVDGYAVRAVDTDGASSDEPLWLDALEAIPAGKVPELPVETGKASRIMTGGVVPVGADAVVMVENTVQFGDRVGVLKPVRAGQNVRERGEDVLRGQITLSQGTVIGPGEIGLLASFQKSILSVARRPLVAILSTGDEVVDLDEPLIPGKIVNSNSYTLSALVREAGGIPQNLGIIRDDPDLLKQAIDSALHADFLLSTGGVSVGDYDYIKSVLIEAGADVKFWKVLMKPGKPLAYGILKGKPFFGLPGNPVSCMVSFLLFVRLALRKAMGYPESAWRLPEVRAVLQNDVMAGGDRRHYLRGRVMWDGHGFRVSTLSGQGSGMLHSMVGTNGLVIVETGTTGLPEGSEVSVLLMRPIL